MSASAALRTYVLADPAIAAVVGQRMHLNEAPLESKRPLIVYRLVSARPQQTLVGATPLVRWWYQIGARSERMTEAEALADLVQARLDGYQPQPGGGIESSRWLNRITGWDPTLDSHSVDDDYAVWATP